MKKDFDQLIKDSENELLALKTASEYSSIRMTNFSSSTQVTTGLYRITYENSGEDIFSLIYCGVSSGNWGVVSARTPVGNTQVIEVVTDIDVSSGWEVFSAPLVVVSNIPVVRITRI